MNQQTKDAYADKMAAQLKEWGAKVDYVKAKIAQGTADVRLDYHHWLEEWQNKEHSFRDKLTEVRNSGVEGFEIVKTGAQLVWDDLSHLMHKVTDKKEPDTKH